MVPHRPGTLGHGMAAAYATEPPMHNDLPLIYVLYGGLDMGGTKIVGIVLLLQYVQ